MFLGDTTKRVRLVHPRDAFIRDYLCNGRANVEKSPFTDILLPLPTPVGFGVPLECPRFKPLKET